MADSRNKIGLHVVEQTKTSHILKNDCGPEDLAMFVVHADHAGQNKSFFVIETQAKRLGQVGRQKIARHLSRRARFLS